MVITAEEAKQANDEDRSYAYGYAECLEILSAIISGFKVFMLPLKEDHRTQIFE